MGLTNNYLFNNEDEKAAELFFKLGVPKHIAKSLIFISNANECQSRDIEHGANLRQPEVSMATQELQTRGWIVKREIRRKGKGRPIQVFRTALNISIILDSLEEEKIEEFEKSKIHVAELKDILSK